MNVFHMTYVKNTTFHKLKKTAKHPVYEDKSDTCRKVVIVRGTLTRNFIFRTVVAKFWYMLHYCMPTMNLYKKKTLLRYWEKMVKNRPIIAIICIITGYYNFEI